MKKLARSRNVIALVLVPAMLWLAACSSPSSDRPVGHHSDTQPPFVAEHKGKPDAVVDSASQPNWAITAFGSVWVTHDAGYVSRIDPHTNHVETKIQLHTTPGPLVAAAGSVWVTDSDRGVVQIDARSNRVTGVVHVSTPLTGIASGFGYLWATNSLNEKLYQIDGHTRKVLKTVSVPDASSVATGFGSVWVAGGSNFNVVQVQPQTVQNVHTIKVPQGVHNIAVIGDSVWVSSGPNGDTVSRIDPSSRQVRGIKLEQSSFPDGLTGTDGVIWVGEYQGNRVDAIDPSANQVIARVHVGAGPAIVARGFGSLWVNNYEGSSVWRLPFEPPG